MKILLGFAFFALLQFNLYSKSYTSKDSIKVMKFGDYFISNHEFVHGNILSIKHSGSYSESDSLITIFNSKGKVLFTDTITNEPSNDVSISVDTLSFCGVGTLIAYNSNENSGYGNCTNSIQLWGYNKSGEFVPYTGFISVCDGTNPKIKWVRSKLLMKTEGNEYDCPSDKEILIPYMVVQHETEISTVSILDYYKIDFNGLKNTKNYPAEKIDKQPILIDNVQLETREYDKTTLSKLRNALYSKPSLSSLKKPIIVKENNLIKFQYCTQTPSNFWIFITINDVDGYIRLGDLEKLGFEINGVRNQ
jgi:hypothetical protein